MNKKLLLIPLAGIFIYSEIKKIQILQKQEKKIHGLQKIILQIEKFQTFQILELKEDLKKIKIFSGFTKENKKGKKN